MMRGFFVLPLKGQLPLQDALLNGGGVGASSVDEGGLEAREGDLIYEPFTPPRPGRFPRHEYLLSDETADGGGGVSESSSSLLHGNATGGGKGIYD